MNSSHHRPGSRRGPGLPRASALVLSLAAGLPVAAQNATCLPSPAVQPLLFAGGKAGARPATLYFSAAFARAGVVAAGPTFDGPALLQAMDDPWAMAGTGPGGEPVPRMELSRPAQGDSVVRIDRRARFIHVAMPDRREGRQVVYSVARFALVPGAAVYRLVLAPLPRGAGCAAPSVDAASNATVSFKGARLQRMTALESSSFTVPQTAVQLTVGRRQPDLYQAATEALQTPGFTQDSRQGAASRPGELVLGSAAGLHSPSDFDVQMRLMGKGALDIAVLSSRQPMEINTERARARELSDRVLQVFPMLAPPAARAPAPARAQDNKP
ncbi:MAG: hypothetical protein EOO54_22255 [Haliea sp.]|nr:MAG: hypothetical protein EOO54_22255 [Haliea sp.]